MDTIIDTGQEGSGQHMPDKLRIAMLGHKRIPSNEGGVEVVVEALSAGLVARGHGVTCYNRAGTIFFSEF